MLCEVPNGTGGRPSKSLTLEQAKALLEAAERSPMRAYTVVSLLTSARTEELRHSFVSLLSSSGVPIEDISRLVGHVSTNVTEKVYRHELKPVMTR